MHRKLATALALSAVIAPLAAAPPEEPVDYGMVTRIRDEGFNNSKVMDTLSQLTDVYGPRLTGSPQNKTCGRTSSTTRGVRATDRSAWAGAWRRSR